MITQICGNGAEFYSSGSDDIDRMRAEVKGSATTPEKTTYGFTFPRSAAARTR